MRADNEFTESVRLGAIAVVSAVAAAMLVIGVGRSLLPQHDAEAEAPAVLVRASLP